MQIEGQKKGDKKKCCHWYKLDGYQKQVGRRDLQMCTQHRSCALNGRGFIAEGVRMMTEGTDMRTTMIVNDDDTT